MTKIGRMRAPTGQEFKRVGLNLYLVACGREFYLKKRFWWTDEFIKKRLVVCLYYETWACDDYFKVTKDYFEFHAFGTTKYKRSYFHYFLLS